MSSCASSIITLFHLFIIDNKGILSFGIICRYRVNNNSTVVFFIKTISYWLKKFTISVTELLSLGRYFFIKFRFSIAKYFNFVISFIDFSHCTYTGPLGTIIKV